MHSAPPPVPAHPLSPPAYQMHFAIFSHVDPLPKSVCHAVKAARTGARSPLPFVVPQSALADSLIPPPLFPPTQYRSQPRLGLTEHVGSSVVGISAGEACC
jgi:hypothetical protein